MRANGTTTRRRVLKGTAAAGLAGLAGCTGGSNQGGSTPTPTPSQSGGGSTSTPSTPETLSTKLAVSHYPTIPDSTPFLVGVKKGIYAKHNVKISDVTSFSGGGTTVRGIVTGGIGMGGTALPALVQAYDAGAPIYLSGLEMSQSPINFMVKADSPIEKIQDCKGKTIAVSTPGSSSEGIAIASVKAADGIAIDDVTIMHAGGLGEAITAMQKGKADVTWNIPPKSTAMAGKGDTRIVWWGRDYSPNFTEMVLAVGGQVKRNTPDLAKNLLHAQVECFNWVKNNPDETAALWAKAGGFPESLAKKALDESNPQKIFRTISPDQKVLTATANTLIDQNLIKKQPNWKDIVWQEPLPKDKQVDWL